MFKLVFFENESGRMPAKEAIKALTEEEKIKVGGELLKVQWKFPFVGMPLVEKVTDLIWVVRVQSRGHWVRVFFAKYGDQNLVALHAVVKQQNALDPKDIRLAERRLRVFLS